MTPEFEQKIRSLIERNIPITVIAIDSDEFCLVLIDYSLNKSRDVIARAQEHLPTIDRDRLVAFSWARINFSRGYAGAGDAQS